ncbi:hypothetical protein C7E12_22600, partial [Stenotrophomonas maltophilia]
TAAIKAQNAQVAIGQLGVRRREGQQLNATINAHTYGLSVAEVTAAIKAQNAQVAIGQLGVRRREGQQLNATINA